MDYSIIEIWLHAKERGRVTWEVLDFAVAVGMFAIGKYLAVITTITIVNKS